MNKKHNSMNNVSRAPIDGESSTKSQAQTYRQRLRRAFDFRNNTLEATSRTVIPTLLASLAISAWASDGRDTPVPAVYKKEPTPAHTRTVKVPGKKGFEPGKISEVAVKGPGVKLNMPQVFAPNFQASPFDSRQNKKIDNLVDEFNKIIKDSPDSTVVINIDGFSSDESEKDSNNGNLNLGINSDNNDKLALQRARLVEKRLSSKLPESEKISIKVTGNERQLSDDEIFKIDSIAKHHGESREDLIKAFNAGAIKLNRSENNLLNNLLVADRGADVTSIINSKQKPDTDNCDEILHEVQYPATYQKVTFPGKPGFSLNILPLIIPPLPRRKRKKRQAEFRRDQVKLPKELLDIPKKRTFRFPLPLKIIVPLVLFFPWVSNSSKEEKKVITRTDCVKVETYKPAQKSLWLNNLPIAVYRLINGRSNWNKQLLLSNEITEPYDYPQTITTVKEHERIFVDENNHIIGRQDIPENKEYRQN